VCGPRIGITALPPAPCHGPDVSGPRSPLFRKRRLTLRASGKEMFTHDLNLSDSAQALRGPASPLVPCSVIIVSNQEVRGVEPSYVGIARRVPFEVPVSQPAETFVAQGIQRERTPTFA
jgi:hypothetical protein